MSYDHYCRKYFLGLCNQKFSTNMGPVLNDYGAVGVL
jgi:hypothetical protein